MSADRKDLEKTAAERAVSDFLSQVAATPKRASGGAAGRLIFAMDATASREPTWDQAAEIQSSMFLETQALGGLAVQLCFYRGFQEIHWSEWYQDSDALLKRMNAVYCAAGLTQIGSVLAHAIDEASRQSVDALVFVGDCMEEDRDRLADLAGRLGLLGVPAFVFQEGRDPAAEPVFRDVARLTGGAWCPFDAGSPQLLRDLLSAVAVYAAGGRKALERYGRERGGAVLRLTDQMTRKGA
ncbi:VWA domain-containing protein [Thiorhodococcus mannitoliphagus]|uniref:VWA domain-containing protein n=1 Tax=Thiorhodococcus mannitoliphagus TaxID=329406 RepID=A0A6P1DWL1_9GAMM|nr:VWA domain-containing protein [Thiorhodococcus mannitoliphagus]NEX20064.1 VWA domain-containing protein [Thiorhodococcus mannitoliphagus]